MSETFNSGYLWRICLVCALGGFLFGYDWVVITGAKPFYELYFDLRSEMVQGWAMSSALVGCMFGVITCGVLSDRLGRKKLLIFAAILFVVSAIGTGLANEFNTFIVYRLIGGVGIGMASGLSPLYIAEVSPAIVRGRMVSVNQLAIVVGLLAAQIVNWLIARNLSPELDAAAMLQSWYGQTAWRWMFGSAAFPAVLFLILMFTVPESPRWLFQNGREESAIHTLANIGGQDYARTAVNDFKNMAATESERAGISELFRPQVMWLLLIGVVLAAYQQLCGINAIFYYADEIFRAAGFALNAVLINMVTTGTVLLLFTSLAILFVERIGRRTLMLYGSAGLVVLHATIALCYMNNSKGIVVLLLVLAAIACYSCTLAPVTWVLLSEIFPNRIRGAAMSVAVFSLWVSCTLVAQCFPMLNGLVGAAGSFWTFSGICLVGLLFCWATLPETKGKTLEEVEAELLGLEVQRQGN